MGIRTLCLLLGLGVATAAFAQLPAPLRSTDAGIFATGFLPSLIVAAVVVWLFRRRKSPTNRR